MNEMIADIRCLVNACWTCQAARRSNSVLNKRRQQLKAARLWQVVVIDILSFLIPHWCCQITSPIPTPNAAADIIAEVLEESVFS